MMKFKVIIATLVFILSLGGCSIPQVNSNEMEEPFVEENAVTYMDELRKVLIGHIEMIYDNNPDLIRLDSQSPAILLKTEAQEQS